MHTEEGTLGTRLVMDTLSCIIEKEADPSKLIAMSPGGRCGRPGAWGFLRHHGQGQGPGFAAPWSPGASVCTRPGRCKLRFLPPLVLPQA